MSTVNLSRPDVDSRICKISQEGSADCEVNFDRQVLRNDKKYTIGVENITVPMSSTYSLSRNDPVLFYIRRRNAGNNLTAADTSLGTIPAANPIAADFAAIEDTFTTSEYQFNV